MLTTIDRLEEKSAKREKEFKEDLEKLEKEIIESFSEQVEEKNQLSIKKGFAVGGEKGYERGYRIKRKEMYEKGYLARRANTRVPREEV